VARSVGNPYSHARQRSRRRAADNGAIGIPVGSAQPPAGSAAVKRYELELVSQNRAADVAGMTRAEFITALGQYKVSPFEYGADEVLAISLHTSL
jgi:hypothetical protein